MRKLLRVGRPRSRWRSRARTSAWRRRVSWSPTPGRDAGQLAVELRDPPRVVGPAEGEPVHRPAEGGRPVGDGRRGRGRPHEGVQAVDHLREAADEVEVAVADVVERERAADEPVPLAGHRRTQEDALQAREPGVGVEVEPERGPVVAVVAPADGRLVDPPGHPLEVVVGEAEPGPHRLGRGEVEDGGGGHPAGRQLDEVGGDAEERVGGAGRPVGEADAEPVGRVTDVLTGHVGQAEAGRDQRRVGLDVGAHHEDVARLERRVVLEQPDQHLAQHVDLSRGAVAGVDLHREVGGRARPRGGLAASGARLARRSACSQPSRVVGSAWPAPRCCSAAQVAERAAQLAGVAAQRGEQRVPDHGRRTGRRRAPPAPRGRRRQRLPQRGGGLRQPEVDVAVLAERAQQLDLGHGQAGVAEEREPRRAGRGRRRRRAAARASSAWRRSGAGASTRSTSRRHSSACQRRSGSSVAARAVGVVARRASRGRAAGAGRRRTRTGRRAGGPRRSGGPTARRPGRRRRGGW